MASLPEQLFYAVEVPPQVGIASLLTELPLRGSPQLEQLRHLPLRQLFARVTLFYLRAESILKVGFKPYMTCSLMMKEGSWIVEVVLGSSKLFLRRATMPL
jgi:hypothetical protein